MRCLFFLICFLIGFADVSRGLEITEDIDYTLEPVLSSEWVCYIKNGNLYLRTTGELPIRINGPGDDAGEVFSPDLEVKGNSIFISWFEKRLGVNKLFFAVSPGRSKPVFKTVELSGSTQAATAKIIPLNSGRVCVLEIYPGKPPELNLYVCPGNDLEFKRTSLEPPDMEYIYSPSLNMTNDALYMFFYGIKGENKIFGAAAYDMQTMKLRRPLFLKDTKGISFIQSCNIKQSPFAIYKTVCEGRFVLEGIYPGAKGWENFSIRDAEGLDVARMDCRAWDDGKILTVFSGEDKEKFKQRIYTAAGENESWNMPVSRIDNKEFDNTRSWLPRMASEGDRVIVVWEDSRNIRSGIMMKLSTDRGKTWLKNDVLISDAKHYAFRPRISFAEGAFHVAWHQFRDDEKKKADLALMKISWDDAVKMESLKTESMDIIRKEALLRERVGSYWKGMIEKDLKTTYALHDPFYRARIPFDYYSILRGPMVYHSYSIESYRIEGNIASVNVKVKYEVPKLTILGKDNAIPTKEVMTEDTYLFIDGNWSRKFVDALSGGSAVDY